MKNYIMVILATLITGIMLNNANVVKANVSTDVSNVSEVAPISPLDSLKEKETEKIASNANISVKSTVKTTSAAKTTNYTVTKVVKSNSEYNNIAHNLSKYDIYRFNKLVYAHNSSNLLGSIKNLTMNDTFTLTENGVKTTYKVAETKIFEKVDDYTLALCTSGYTNCNGSFYMSSLMNARLNGKSYSIVLFTCDGTSKGNGDATHRRVVFAYQV